MHSPYRIGLMLALWWVSLALISAQGETSPTGNLIYSVYTSNADVALHIYAFETQTSRRISPEGANRKDTMPIFSPNGERIAFLADGFLSIMTIDGGDVITTNIQNPLYVAWSSDNSHISYMTDTDDGYTLQVYSVDDAENRTYETDLIIPIEGVPSWTNDGQAILFAGRTNTESNNDIYRLSLDFQTLTNLTNSPTSSESSPSMSPDGQFISYKVSGIGGRVGDVWLMNSNGGNARDLTNGRLVLGSLYTSHLWSPDSARFLIEDAGKGVAIIDIQADTIDELDAINAVWSPDGRWIAYTTPMQNNRSDVALYDIWIAPADTLNNRQRAIEGAFGKIAWQPDPSLQFEPANVAIPTPSPTPTPMPPQTQVESILGQGEFVSWYFDGDANTPITVIARSEAFDTVLQLFAADGELLAENDDFVDTNSYIDVTLPEDGMYQVVVSAYYGDASGVYTLIVIGIRDELRNTPQGGRFIQPPTPTPSPTSTPTHTSTPLPTFTSTPTSTPTITPSPTLGFDRSQCPANVLPRLEIGVRGRVLPGGNSIVYDQPITNASQLGVIPGGASFTVLDGPICADNRIWWRVEYRNLIGWVVEAGDAGYFVEPLRR